MAIASFKQTDLEDFIEKGILPKNCQWQSVAKIAFKKLDMINYASAVEDLRQPPGNRLERLRGDLNGYFSIRINDQWRIIFRWSENGATDVEIIDYHF